MTFRKNLCPNSSQHLKIFLERPSNTGELARHLARPITTVSRNHGQLLSLHIRYRTRQGQLLILLQDRRLPSRRPLLAKTRQTFLLANHTPTKSIPEPSIRPEEQDESFAAAESFRRLLRGLLVRDVQVRRDRRGGRL